MIFTAEDFACIPPEVEREREFARLHREKRIFARAMRVRLIYHIMLRRHGPSKMQMEWSRSLCWISAHNYHGKSEKEIPRSFPVRCAVCDRFDMKPHYPRDRLIRDNRLYN